MSSTANCIVLRRQTEAGVCANVRSARMDANRGCNLTFDLYHIFLVRRTFREEKVYSNNLLHSVAKTNRSLNTIAVRTLPNKENAITHHQLGSIYSDRTYGDKSKARLKSRSDNNQHLIKHVRFITIELMASKGKPRSTTSQAPKGKPRILG